MVSGLIVTQVLVGSIPIRHPKLSEVSMNHKRCRPKDSRAGCLMCKPHKSNGFKGCLGMQTWQEKRSRVDFEEQLEELDAVENE